MATDQASYSLVVYHWSQDGERECATLLNCLVLSPKSPGDILEMQIMWPPTHLLNWELRMGPGTLCFNKLFSGLRMTTSHNLY